MSFLGILTGPISLSPHSGLSSFFACKDIFMCAHTFMHFHIYTHTDRRQHKGSCTITDRRTKKSTHSLVLSQLMKWLVRCSMCRTYGSLPIHRITLNRRAHSSADMIVLMDGNNIQTTVETQLWVDACVFLSWRGDVCLFLSPCFYFHSWPCMFVFRRIWSRPDCISNSAVSLDVHVY